MSDPGIYFAELEELMLPVSIRRAYERLAGLFAAFLDESVSGSGIGFAGPFPQTDYLLRRYGADRKLRRAVSAARVRFRRHGVTPEAVLVRSLAGDISAFARFVALVSGRAVPASLGAGLQSFDEAGDEVCDRDGDYMRVVVLGTDGNMLRCVADGGECREILLDAGAPHLCHIASLVEEGSQLNLVFPRENKGVYTAAYIVYEPDYLVNVTQVVGCFETYATDARISLVKKMSPPVNNEAVILGNFASRLLDAEIHRADGEETDYAGSVLDFFRSNAVSLATCDIGRDFHTRAREQKVNIEKAVRHTLADGLTGFDRRDVVLEPAFFSEMLGLQGRMDMLQLDGRLLVEQKAGKGEWPCGDFTVPRHRRPHYVQLLLYMAVLRLGNVGGAVSGDDRLDAFLLYSRYCEPLISLGFAPELFAEAMQVRNEIVGIERRIVSGDISPVGNLDAAAFAPQRQDSLWLRYTKPQLESLLEPVRLSDGLERAYFLRMWRFCATEHWLSKSGAPGRRASGLSSAWHCSLSEKLDAGSVYAGLRLVSPTSGHDGVVETIVMRFDPDSCGMANFRPGDAVLLYAYAEGEEPDLRKQMVHRCTIVRIGAADIELRLRFVQSGALPYTRYAASPWAIEHDSMDSSYPSLFAGLRSFLTAPGSRRDLLLMRRRPSVDPRETLRLGHGDFDGLALRVAQARDFFLIIGPPGTGKTSYGMVTTVREELAREGTSVLLLSYTNRAVDEICSKLVECGIDFVRIGQELSTAEDYRPYLLRNRIDGCADVAQVRQLIRGARVVAGTVAAVNAASGILGLRSFSLAVIDEASQILEPQLTGMLSSVGPDGKPSIRRFVMIGDHKQLPAVVLQPQSCSVVDDPALCAIGLTDCRHSLFERLLRRYADDPSVTYMLTRQGRMHRDIADFPSRAFYGGRLLPVPLPHQTAGLGEDAIMGRLAFVNVVGRVADEADKVNTLEAELIAGLVADVYRSEASFDPDDTVGVIVPYRSQINAVRRALASYGIDAFDGITVDTVERFQGSQRKYIFYGFTVKRPAQLGFLTDNAFEEDGAVIDRKLNVAMTRAREHLVIIGNATLLSSNALFRSLVEYTRERGCYYDGCLPSRQK